MSTTTIPNSVALDHPALLIAASWAKNIALGEHLAIMRTSSRWPCEPPGPDEIAAFERARQAERDLGAMAMETGLLLSAPVIVCTGKTSFGLSLDLAVLPSQREAFSPERRRRFRSDDVSSVRVLVNSDATGRVVTKIEEPHAP